MSVVFFPFLSLDHRSLLEKNDGGPCLSGNDAQTRRYDAAFTNPDQRINFAPISGNRGDKTDKRGVGARHAAWRVCGARWAFADARSLLGLAPAALAVFAALGAFFVLLDMVGSFRCLVRPGSPAPGRRGFGGICVRDSLLRPSCRASRTRVSAAQLIGTEITRSPPSGRS